MTDHTKSAVRMIGLAAATVIAFAVAGCSIDGRSDDLDPARPDTNTMAVACMTCTATDPGPVLFEFRVGTAGSAVGFRIRQNRALGTEGVLAVDTGDRTGRPTVVRFNLPFVHQGARRSTAAQARSGPLCFEVSFDQYGTVN